MNIRKSIIFVSAIIFLALFFTSCKEEENIVGLDLQSENDKLNLVVWDTASVYAYSQKETEMPTSKTTLSLLGYVNDPIFGISESGIYSQFRLSVNNLNFGAGAEIDSLVLTLSYEGFFGDTLLPFLIKIYELSDPLKSNETYYHTSHINHNSLNLTETANFYCYPTPKTLHPTDTMQTKPVIRIPLQKDFGKTKFIDKSGSTELADNANFLNYFKGLFIAAQGVNGKGSMIYVNMLNANTSLTLYYHNNEKKGLKHSFIVKDSSVYFHSINHFNYDNAESSLKKQIIDLDYSETDQQLYVQASAGVKTIIHFPYIKEAFKDKKVAIHKAELIITRSDDDYSVFYQPPALDLYYKKDTSSTTAYLLPDYLLGATHFGGEYNATEKEYRFRITRYIQNIIMDKSENYPLHLVVKGAATKANRLVLYGTNPDFRNKRLRLEITYSLIN
jgi:hypothetical protein